MQSNGSLSGSRLVAGDAVVICAGTDRLDYLGAVATMLVARTCVERVFLADALCLDHRLILRGLGIPRPNSFPSICLAEVRDEGNTNSLSAETRYKIAFGAMTSQIEVRLANIAGPPRDYVSALVELVPGLRPRKTGSWCWDSIAKSGLNCLADRASSSKRTPSHPETPRGRVHLVVDALNLTPKASFAEDKVSHYDRMAYDVLFRLGAPVSGGGGLQ